MRLEPDDLAAVALLRGDEPTTIPDGAEDAATLAAFRRVVGLGRDLQPDDLDRTEAPAEVWEGIAARLRDEGGFGGFDGGPDPSGEPGDGPCGDVVAALDDRAGADTDAGGSPDRSGGGTGGGVGGEVIALDPLRRRRRAVAAMAAVAATLVVLGAIGTMTLGGGSGGQEVAAADLELLAGDGHGEAQLVRRDDGLHLVVDVSGLTPAERADHFELWLLSADPDDPDPQPVRTFVEREGTIDVVLPDDVDPDRFPVVDISEELDDGDPTHSGRSILRGRLF